MITLVGTGHVFKIAEPVSFIVKNIWPDAVLVELDVPRYNALIRNDKPEPSRNTSRLYRKMARYQKKVAEKNRSKPGAEFIAAIETGKMIGAAIEFIDVNASQTIDGALKEMSFRERMRFTFSLIGDRIRPGKNADKTILEFAENDDEYLNNIRKKYPTLIRKLIDERNVHMALKISEAAKRHPNIVVIIGDCHVEGISRLLEDDSVRKIRLKTLMDRESMNALKAELWSGTPEDAE